ncbi:MAG: hypothetical protein RLZZ479_1555 [Bacteroidota bacterium]
METASIKTPLGIATITGDENGIAKIAIAEEGLISEVIPFISATRSGNAIASLF